MQKDYVSCYLSLCDGSNLDQVRLKCSEYLDCAAIEWRNRFFEIANLLSVYDGDTLIQQNLNTENNQDKFKGQEFLETTLQQT